MPAINANIVVDTTTLTLSPTTTTIGFTVDPINLNLYALGNSVNPPGGTIGQLQYNDGANAFAGLANANVDGGTLTFSNLANLKIDGGTSGYSLITDGAGVLSWGLTSKIVNGTSNVDIATVNGNIDFTVGSAPVASLSTTGNVYPAVLTVQGNINAYNNITAETGAQFVGDGNGISWQNASNVEIGGGTNGYVLGTDGAGGLDWIAQGGAGTGNPGGANTNIQFNDSGLFGGNVGFTFNKVTGNVDMLNLVTSGVTMDYGFESINLSVSTPSTEDFNFYDKAITYKTANATSNVVLNFRGNSTVSLDSFLPNSHSVTGTYVMQNGTTGYSISSITIDSTAQPIQWLNRVAPEPVSNSKASYTFTIIKTSTTPTYDVLGSGAVYAL